MIVDSIKETLTTCKKSEIETLVDEEEDFVEGRILFRKHRSLVCNQMMISKAKKSSIENEKCILRFVDMTFYINMEK